MFSHALSSHKASNDIDFYSAVDDRKDDAGDAGAGMIGTLEFISATYYRYAAVNLDLLFDNFHLGKLKTDERKAVLSAFIRATLMAVPGARKNSMNAATLPFEVLGILKDKGQPIQLINAFETPVIANGKGLAEASLAALKSEHDKLKRVWGIQPMVETWLTQDGLETFITKLIGHVQ
jgi:CRISPR system Cascade subunit CasC